MDISISNYIQHIPQILLTTLLAVFHLTPTSSYQSIWTQFMVALGRPVLQTPASILKCQQFFNKDYLGAWGPWWYIKQTISIHNDEKIQENVSANPIKDTLSVREALAFAIRVLAKDTDSASCTISTIEDLQVEWSCYRPPSTFFLNPFRHRSNSETFHKMTSSLPSNCPVILHFHGGAHCLMNPATHRPITTLLSARSGSLIYAPHYRLSPQNPFPAALLDGLVAYLSLIFPPTASVHQAISPNRIIFSGDSSGAALASSLALLLLTLHKHSIRITLPYNTNNTNSSATTISIPSPSCTGLSLISPYLDITRSLPSQTLNAPYDILAPPPSPTLNSPTPPFPPDAIWPTRPPRTETYVATAEMCAHPLVSPLAATSSQWMGLDVDVFVQVGWEACSDEAEIMARRIAAAMNGEKGREKGKEEGQGEGEGDGVGDEQGTGEESKKKTKKVVFEGWQGMPHLFSGLPFNRAAWRANGSWARFCWVAVMGGGGEKMDEARWIHGRDGKVRWIRMEELGVTQVGCGYDRKEGLTDEVVERKIEDGRRWRVELERKMVEEWQALQEKTG